MMSMSTIETFTTPRARRRHNLRVVRRAMLSGRPKAPQRAVPACEFGVSVGRAISVRGAIGIRCRAALHLAALLACVLLVWTRPAAATDAAGDGTGPGLRDGEVLSQENWEKAKGLLPPEVLEMYRKGDFFHTVKEISLDDFRISDKFLAASEKNAGRFALTPEGTIIHVATGKNPAFVYGYPFPHIDATDPDAEKGNLAWISRSGIDRHIFTDGFNRFYGGYQYPGRDHSKSLLKQFLNPVTQPADLRGTVSLGYRYRDTKVDAQWAYVPALRRVREVSPTNRSDAVLGSDMSVADNNGLDEKVEWMNWRLVGETEVYTFFEKLAVDGAPPSWIEKAPEKDGGGYKISAYWNYTGPTVALESKEWWSTPSGSTRGSR